MAVAHSYESECKCEREHAAVHRNLPSNFGRVVAMFVPIASNVINP